MSSTTSWISIVGGIAIAAIALYFKENKRIRNVIAVMIYTVALGLVVNGIWNLQGDVYIQYNNVTQQAEASGDTSPMEPMASPVMTSTPSPIPSPAVVSTPSQTDNPHLADMHDADKLQGVTVPDDESWFDVYISGTIYQKDGNNILLIDNPVPNENKKIGELSTGAHVTAMARQSEYLLVIDQNKTVGWINAKYFRSA